MQRGDVLKCYVACVRGRWRIGEPHGEHVGGAYLAPDGGEGAVVEVYCALHYDGKVAHTTSNLVEGVAAQGEPPPSSAFAVP